VCRFGPDRRLTALCAVLSLTALGLAVWWDDAAGRLLAALSVLILGGYAVTDIVFWPRLTASGRGLRIRTPTDRTDLPWADIDAIRVDERSRLGLQSRTLEIDAGPQLVVFSRRMLGEDPRTVLDVLEAFDPRRPH
jgi:hypothetical protein